MKLRFALFFIAHCAILAGAAAQNTSNAKLCAAPADIQPVQLHGLWRVEFEGQPPATALFEKNPERRDSLFGAVNRDGVRSLLAGDLEDGELLLDESDDGQHIHAVWSGTVVAASCGKEITGTWRNASDNTERRFVLRKLPGWQ